MVVKIEDVNTICHKRKCNCLVSLRDKRIMDFFGYRNGRCISQQVGKYTFGNIPSKIAHYLDYVSAEEYTFHCRTSNVGSNYAKKLTSLH